MHGHTVESVLKVGHHFALLSKFGFDNFLNTKEDVFEEAVYPFYVMFIP